MRRVRRASRARLRPAPANSEHILGPLIATFACIALWEVTRAVRWINLPLGLATMLAPWILGHPFSGQINNTLCGMAIAGFACLGGKIQHRFGGGWVALWRAGRGA